MRRVLTHREVAISWHDGGMPETEVGITYYRVVTDTLTGLANILGPVAAA
jgi:hypothetical protein